jgi:hypothetical protein
MNVAPGTRLGPHEGRSILGADAVGEVYRARHTRLDRSGASKVPAEVLTADTSSRIGFKREGKAISVYIPRTRAAPGIRRRIVEHHDGRTCAKLDANRHGASFFTLPAIP